MPVLRGASAVVPRSRRRSSVFAPAKAGIYGVSSSSASMSGHLPPRPISFAPNVTPITFNESSDSSSSSTPEPSSPNPQPKLFPPSETPAPPPARKRCPPGKRRSQGYIPRPPNAFMLFRADFVRQKHVPGSIETNHGSLSKIIGNCWRSLPLDEKRVWEQKAKHEKAAHKVQYPNYRFRPVHNKNKKAKDDAAPSAHPTHAASSADKKDRHQPTFEEEIRCEEVTQLLLEGKKGEELAQALRDLEKRREIEIECYRRSETPSTGNSIGVPLGGIMSAPQPTYASTIFGKHPAASYLHRRSSSVPLPHNNNYDWPGDYYMDAPPYQDAGIALPSVPFVPPSSSPGIAGFAEDSSMRPSFSALSKQQRIMLGHRRSSSAGAAYGGLQRSCMNMSYGGYGNMDTAFNWTTANDMVLQRDDSALPDVDLSLFDPQFLSGASLQHSRHPLSNSVSQASPASALVVEEEGPGGNAHTTTPPNGAFNVSELYSGLPSQHNLGPLDTTGLRVDLDGGMGLMVSSVDSNGSPSASYWTSHATPSPAQLQHRPLFHQFNQPAGGGLQLEFGGSSSGSPGPSAGQYDQMYMAEDNHTQYGTVMGGGYEGVDVGYDMGVYVTASYNQGHHSQHHHQSYVEC